jgi:hypothetical protein
MQLQQLQQQPLLDHSRDVNGSPLNGNHGSPSPLHYSRQLPSQYNNVSMPTRMNNNAPVNCSAIHHVPVPHHQQYGTDIKQSPQMPFTGRLDVQPPQYVKN